MLRDIEVQEYFLIILPLVLLALWLWLFTKKKAAALLIVSVLLVLFDLPHLLVIPAVLSGGGMFGSDSLPYLLFLLLLGVLSLVHGFLGDYRMS